MQTRLKDLRQSIGMNMKEFASFLNIKYTTYVGYENGTREPGSDFLTLVAKKFGTTTDYILMLTDNPVSFSHGIMPLPSTRSIPIIGEIACGRPILAEENFVGWANIPENIKADFCLVCKGDSMVGARIFDGDLVCIRQQERVDNGEIAAVMIEDEATLKRVYLFPGHYLELRAENPNFAPMKYSGESMSEVRILGKALYFISQVIQIHKIKEISKWESAQSVDGMDYS